MFLLYYYISLGHTTVNTITLQHEHEHRIHSDKLREDRRKLTQTYKQKQNDGEGRQNTDAGKILIKYCLLDHKLAPLPDMHLASVLEFRPQSSG